MSLQSGGRRAFRRAVGHLEAPIADLPLFLCPGFLRATQGHFTQRPQLRPIHSTSRYRNNLPSAVPRATFSIKEAPEGLPIYKLPPQCSGCGALSQTVDASEAGFFDLQRKSVKQYVWGTSRGGSSEEDAIFEQSLKLANDKDAQFIKTYGFDAPAHSEKAVKPVIAPICERCHTLKHHEKGVSIHHPSLQSIQDTIFESPYKYNHIYHVIDAADFPMSMIPSLHKLLHMTPLRSLNRRSKTGRFYHGKKTEISFIITRSDLLAPKKEQVDSMMPYLRTVLREALGRVGNDVRLGNIRCISAKQAWWTKELKEEIWNRGGGGWMVGKVNVGKSQLFREVFPKGRSGKADFYGKAFLPSPPSAVNKFKPMSVQESRAELAKDVEQERSSAVGEQKWQPMGVYRSSTSGDAESVEVSDSVPSKIEAASITSSIDQEHLSATDYEDEYKHDEAMDTGSLLPPAQIETAYPDMPLVSSLPGTTASPIRVPFGNGKGELIDLPGLSRGDLELHVLPEHRSSLVMRARVKPEQQVIKPGQSLLLGGIIRVTPTTPDVIFLAYNFNPLKPHLTSTEKAIGTQTQTRESNVENISLPGTGEKISSAGVFHLKWDVTKQRTGPITARDAAGLSVERLPYKVMSADILIEGCGWLELTAQIRKRPGEMSQNQESPYYFNEEDQDTDRIDPQWPTVEVFTPGGKFAGIRRPMNAWLNSMEKPSERNTSARPRRSMKGMKKLSRQRVRAKASL